MTSLFAGTPWIEQVVFDALLGKSVPEPRPKLVQVISTSSDAGAWLRLSDGQTHISALSPHKDDTDSQLPPTRGCVVRIRDWHVCPLLALADRKNAPAVKPLLPAKPVVCLYLGEPVQVLGGRGLGIVGDPQEVHATVPVRRALQSLESGTFNLSLSERVQERLLQQNRRLEHLLKLRGTSQTQQQQKQPLGGRAQPEASRTAAASGADLPIGNVEALFASQNQETLQALWSKSKTSGGDSGFRVEALQGGTAFVVKDVQQMLHLFDNVRQAAAKSQQGGTQQQEQPRERDAVEGRQQPLVPAPTSPSERLQPPQERQHGALSPARATRPPEESLEEEEDEGDDDEEGMGISNMLVSQEDEDEGDEAQFESQLVEPERAVIVEQDDSKKEDANLLLETQQVHDQHDKPMTQEQPQSQAIDEEEEGDLQGLETQAPVYDFLQSLDATPASKNMESSSSRKRPRATAQESTSNRHDEEEDLQGLETQAPAYDSLQSLDTNPPSKNMESSSSRKRPRAAAQESRSEHDDDVVNMDLVKLGVAVPRKKNQPMSSMERLWRSIHQEQEQKPKSPHKKQEEFVGGLAGDYLRSIMNKSGYD